MENYKILENRPELSSEQLTEGMDFTKIKTNAALAKTTVLKAVILKSLIGLTIIVSGILIYNKISIHYPKKESSILINTTKESIENNQPVMSEAIITPTVTPPKKEKYNNSITTAAEKTVIIDTPKTTSATKVQAITASSSVISDEAYTDTVIHNLNHQSVTSKNQKTAKNIKIKSCKIICKSDYCHIPNVSNAKYTIDCDGCEFDHIKCQNVNNMIDITCVLLTLSTDQKQDLKIENKLRNISLVNDNNKPQQPLMMGLGSDTNFMGSNFKAKKFLINFNKEISIILFFKSAKAGDKVLINNFIEAQIEK